MAVGVSCVSLGLHPTSTGCIQQLHVSLDGKLRLHSETNQVSFLRVISSPLVPTTSSTSTAISVKQKKSTFLAGAISAGFEPDLQGKGIPSPGKFTIVQALSTETAHQQTSTPPVELDEDVFSLVLELAKSEERLRAAAALRARSFYMYPEDRSEAARKTHQKMKADDEWAVLTRKIGGLEQGYKRTSCVIASCPSSEVPDSGTDLHESCTVAGPRAESYVLVGTLDLNQGLCLPGEVMGEFPKGPEAEYRRAYLSNVCVAEEVRRKGVGMTLIEHAKKTAKLWGISDLYVHVVVDNTSARKLYEKAGFVYEKEESIKEARSLGRPRRYLLRIELI